MNATKVNKYSKEFKAKILQEVKVSDSIRAVAKKYGVPAPTVYLWVRLEQRGVPNAEPDINNVIPIRLGKHTVNLDPKTDSDIISRIIKKLD